MKLESKLSYSNYLDRTEKNLIIKPRYFWKFIRARLFENYFLQIMYLDNIFVDNNNEISNLFGIFFKSVYVSSKQLNISFDVSSSNVNDLNFIGFPLKEVFELLSSLNPKTSFDPDSIPSIILRNCTFFLTLPRLL